MPNKQRTFELVDAPKVHRPMTSKQAKKAYQKANRTPRISKAEQKRRDAEELAKHRKAYEKEQAAAKAKAARDKKAAKALEQREERKRLGIPEPNRHVRASQSRISMFIKQGNKRSRETNNTREESESTICEDLDDEPPAKRLAVDNPEDQSEALSKPIALRDLEYQMEPQTKRFANNSFDDEENISAGPIVPNDSEDEFGDFPPLSDNDISLLDTGSMKSTLVNTIYCRPRSGGPIPPFQKPSTSLDDGQELPQMKNVEREQMTPDDPFQLEDMLDSQIRSEAADAACRSDRKNAELLLKEQFHRDDTRPMTPTSNHPVNDMSVVRELLWHTSINGRHDSSDQSFNVQPPLALPEASAANASHRKLKNSYSNVSLVRRQFDNPPSKNINGAPKTGTGSPSNFSASAKRSPFVKKSMDIGSATVYEDNATPPHRASSRMIGLSKQTLQEGSLYSPALKSQNVESQSHKYPTPTSLKQQRCAPREIPIQSSKSAPDTHPVLQERSINMGPPALPQKRKLGMSLAPLPDNRQTVSSSNLPPSSTQAFIESHLDEFFTTPTQEARELCDDPITPRPSMISKIESRYQSHHQKQEDMKDCVSKAADDEFGEMLSTQELRMFSQDWETASSPPRQGNENKIETPKQISAAPEDIQNLICSQNLFLMSQELTGMQSVSKVKSPTIITSQLPQAQKSTLERNQHSTAKPQTQLPEPPCISTPQVDADVDLTPKPRRSPWFKEKPEDRYPQKRFFTEKPEDLEAAAIEDSKEAWEEIKEATSSNRHNFDDDLEPEVDELLKAALAESKEWDEVYKAVVPTPTPRKNGEKEREGMEMEGKEHQTPSRIAETLTGGSAVKNGAKKFERAPSVASTDYGDGEDSDWDGFMAEL
ncbi:hypothetical protein SBOR_3984 [Sclerotinia borealis F-4128]|uniref:Uncharacterized protein n=1 Tax=Sclerotinia borealis (strain F-4128) TaxID=1432307 RepID=W9CID3_SCLBF|nr:hypothetical protein SBOR_3984 [Sclerotinia borealis F-4128]